MRLDGFWFMNAIFGPLNILIFILFGGLVSLIIGTICSSIAIYDYYMHRKENHG